MARTVNDGWSRSHGALWLETRFVPASSTLRLQSVSTWGCDISVWPDASAGWRTSRRRHASSFTTNKRWKFTAEEKLCSEPVAAAHRARCSAKWTDCSSTRLPAQTLATSRRLPPERVPTSMVAQSLAAKALVSPATSARKSCSALATGSVATNCCRIWAGIPASSGHQLQFEAA